MMYQTALKRAMGGKKPKTEFTVERAEKSQDKKELLCICEGLGRKILDPLFV